MRRPAEWEDVRRYQDQRAIFRDELNMNVSFFPLITETSLYWNFYCRHPLSDSAVPLECICPCLSSSIIFKEQDSTMFKRHRIERQKKRGLYASSDTCLVVFCYSLPC